VSGSPLATSDIENGLSSDAIGGGYLCHLCRRFPICFAHHSVPRFEAGLRVRMLTAELYQSVSF
jgi:hypothetical protein